VWFYDLTNDGFELKQTRKPIPGDQLPDFIAKWRNHETNENSWRLTIEEIAAKDFELTAKNPNRQDDHEHRTALELVESIKTKEERVLDLLAELETLLDRSP